MSTTIDVYPTTSFFPLVEHTRARTQQLFQQLLNLYGIGSTIEVKAFYPAKNPEDDVRYVAKDVVWEVGMELGFSYWINGEWDSSSWPRCVPVEADDLISEEDLVYSFCSKPEHLGQWAIVEEFEDVLPAEQLAKILAQDHYWYEYRNATPVVATPRRQSRRQAKPPHLVRG
ncbi:hypothetical protein [Trueperella bialowiezensis]|uniref:Uncharacterized protein n=1 Tax=Trueperella bialowiezensis TaxID=312285 RepID=A0A448PFR2_9ACTO|nr:hypothetical protein [Trueperella bialowiezensis]VEI13801.1 Uncharacterised protein [Trueperella bialowiezensis]